MSIIQIGYQFIYIIAAILSIPFFPLLFLMGSIAKKKTGKLPDAKNPSGRLDGNQPVIRLVVLGESTVAGVGVEEHEEGVTYSVAKTLNQLTDRNIKWEAVGTSGFTARKVNEQLAHKVSERLPEPHIICIMLGGNDTFELNSPLRWRRDMASLINRLQSLHPDAKLVVVNLPPVKNFTSFSSILQWYLGSLTNLHRKVIMDFESRFDNLIYMSEEIDFDAWRKEEGRDVPMEEFFSDGVHPSALTYKLWGKQIGERIVKEMPSL